jgi:hypothetical protein
MTIEEARFALAPLVAELARIATALEQFGLDPEPAASGCEHQPAARIDFGITNGQADWQCRDCGYRTVAKES